jgi:FMN phosphatase YigB (HAD superfamily)
VPESPDQIRAVLFDFAGTLFARQPALDQVAMAARRIGLALDPHQCEQLAARFLAAGLPGGPYPDSVPVELEALYARRDLGPVEHRSAYVALLATVAAPKGLAAAVYERVLAADGWVPYVDTHPVIERLVARGITVGVISNVGFDLRPILVHHRCSELAQRCTLSFEVHVAKPALEIFRRALVNLEAQPCHTLMVGDHPSADGGGAALGIRTLILPMSPPGARQGLGRVLELVDGAP